MCPVQSKYQSHFTVIHAALRSIHNLSEHELMTIVVMLNKSSSALLIQTRVNNIHMIQTYIQ